MQPRLRLQHLAHLHAVELLVALRPRTPHRRPARGIQQPELDAHSVGHLAHDAAQRIHLAHQVALGHAANGRIAAHLRDQVHIHGDQRGLQPMRAAAMAASHPACPAPTTTTSYCSVKAIQAILRILRMRRSWTD